MLGMIRGRRRSSSACSRYYGSDPKMPNLEPAGRVPAQAGDAHPGSQQRPDRRARLGEADGRSLFVDPEDVRAGGGRRRGRRLLQARRRRLHGHGARVHHQRAARAEGAGRIDDHAAGDQEPAADARAQRCKRKVQEIILARRLSREAVEGGDPRALPEPDLLRPRPLRLRGGGALLLRQVGEGDRPRRGGAAGRAAAEPGAAVAAQASGGGQGAPALRARARWPTTASSIARPRSASRPSRSAWRARPRRRAGWRPRRSTWWRAFLADKLGEAAAFEAGTTVATTLDAQAAGDGAHGGRARAGGAGRAPGLPRAVGARDRQGARQPAARAGQDATRSSSRARRSSRGSCCASRRTRPAQARAKIGQAVRRRRRGRPGECAARRRQPEPTGKGKLGAEGEDAPPPPPLPPPSAGRRRRLQPRAALREGAEAARRPLQARRSGARAPGRRSPAQGGRAAAAGARARARRRRWW